MPCLDGEETARGVGECRAGVIVCADEAWRPCEGMVLPRDEACNGLDDDCDGQVDDGVLSECGTCGECDSACWGQGDCSPWGKPPIGTRQDADGALLLSDVGPVPHVLWLTDIGGLEGSEAPGAVHRVDTRDLEVEASFWTTSERSESFVSSHVAVDADGDGLVATSDGFGGGRASVSRIAGEVSHCIDRDGDGAIRTSTGPEDRLAFDSPDAWEDECLLWHTLVGTETGEDASAVAVGTLPELDGSVQEIAWVGFSSEAYSVEAYDAQSGDWTGDRTGDVSIRDLLVDADGVLWTAIGQSLGRLDPAAGEDVFERIDVPLGDEKASVDTLTIDETGTIWAAGTHVASRSPLGEWEVFDPPFADPPGGSFGNPTADGRGRVWFAWMQGLAARDHVYRLSAGPGAALEAIEESVGGTRATTADFDGRFWSFGWMWSGGQTIDLGDGAIEAVFEDGPFVRPSASGDLTGLRRWTALHPRSPWTAIAESCPDALWIDVEIEADLPGGAGLLVSARAADDLAALADAPWDSVGSMPPQGPVFELGAFDGTFLQISLRLLGYEETPVLRRVTLRWSCP